MKILALLLKYYKTVTAEQQLLSIKKAWKLINSLISERRIWL